MVGHLPNKLLGQIQQHPALLYKTKQIGGQLF
jgi:hypothetical protein